MRVLGHFKQQERNDVVWVLIEDDGFHGGMRLEEINSSTEEIGVQIDGSEILKKQISTLSLQKIKETAFLMRTTYTLSVEPPNTSYENSVLQLALPNSPPTNPNVVGRSHRPMTFNWEGEPQKQENFNQGIQEAKRYLTTGSRKPYSSVVFSNCVAPSPMNNHFLDVAELRSALRNQKSIKFTKEELNEYFNVDQYNEERKSSIWRYLCCFTSKYGSGSIKGLLSLTQGTPNESVSAKDILDKISSTRQLKLESIYLATGDAETRLNGTDKAIKRFLTALVGKNQQTISIEDTASKPSEQLNKI